jgi:DNA polymerase
MDRALSEELRAALAASRAWLGEWLEEGVEARVRPPPSPAAARRPAPAAARTAPLPRAPGEPTPAAGPRPTLEDVRAQLGDCTRCPLSAGRSTIVFGDGNPDAAILFVGEGPGAEEDKRGLPFVGRAGELLTRMIERGMGIPRSQVYICNIVKCRPPQNREPMPNEIAACRPFLDAQIDAVAPKVIVSLGRPATGLLLGRDVSITRVRGVWHDYRGTPVMPTFHPAFVLRQYTEENRRLVWQDLRAALERAQPPI